MESAFEKSVWNIFPMTLPKYITLVFLLFSPLFTSALPTTRSTVSQNETSYSWITHPLIGQGPRQECSVVALGESVYVLGGVDYNENQDIQTLNRVEFFNTSAQTWHVAAPMPQPINHANTASVDGKIYNFGGLNGAYEWAAIPECYVYYPNNDTWLTQTYMPNNTARGASAVGVYGSTVYLAGGMTILEAHAQSGIMNSLVLVSSYDTATGLWSALPDLPEPRQHVAGAVVGSTFYVIGGRENSIAEYHNTTYALNLTNPTGWETLAPIPTARGSLACSAIGVKIFCFGGEGNPDNWQKIFNETQVYDTTTNTWENLEAMPVPRHGTGAATVGNRVYIPGKCK